MALWPKPPILYSYTALQITKRYPMGQTVRRLLTGTFSFLIVIGIIQAGIDLSSWHEKHKRPFEVRLPTVPPPGYTARYQSTAHEILKLEAEYGLVSPSNAETATAILDQTIDRFKELDFPEEPTLHEMISLLKGIGRFIGARYIYGGTTFADGLVEGELDCDLRSYVYLAITENIGVEGVGVIYSPGHAFIGWRSPDSDQFPIAWETTTETGEIANLASPQYKKVTSYKHDYQIQDREGILAMYQAIVADYLFERGRKSEAKTLLTKLQEKNETPFYDAVLSQFEDGIDHAEKYLSHTNSQHARYLIANNLYAQGKKEEALNHYKAIFAETTYDKTVTDRLGELHEKSLSGWYIQYIYGPTARGLDRIFAAKDDSKIVAEFAKIMPILFIIWMFIWFAIVEAVDKRCRPWVTETKTT